MELLKAIAKRRSVRSYESGKIPEETLETILAAGCAAPVARGLYESLHITVVENKDLISRISEAVKKLRGATHDPLYGAPMLIMISSDSRPVIGQEYTNAACMAQNMMLAAAEQGVGSVMIWASAEVVEADPELMAALEIPEGFKPRIGVVYGYAADAGKEKSLKVTVKTNRV